MSPRPFNVGRSPSRCFALLRPLATALLASVAAAAAPRSWLPSLIPNPMSDPQGCSFDAAARLCDPDGILSSAGRQQVDNVLSAIRAGSRITCPNGDERGVEVGFAIVRRMHADEIRRLGKEAAAKKFAEELGNRWGLGDPGCRNGVVLFASIDDRFAYVKTAQAARSLLTDRLSTVVVDNMKPLLRDSNYDDALLQAALQIHDVLLGKTIPGSRIDWIPVCMFFLVFLIVGGAKLVLVILFRVVLMPVAYLLDSLSSRWGAGERRKAERDLQRVQSEINRDEFDQTMCPVCLENFDARDRKGSVALECKHRFHRACIAPWLEEHVTCPLCRSDLQHPLAPEDESKPENYQRRLRWYLSRLQQRHPTQFSSGAHMYGYNDDGLWVHRYADTRRDTDLVVERVSYAETLQARYQSVMDSLPSLSTGSGSSNSVGDSSGWGGGGGFSDSDGGGGGGGGW